MLADEVVTEWSNKLFNEYQVCSLTSTVNDDSSAVLFRIQVQFRRPDESIVCQSGVEVTWLVIVARQVETQLVCSME